MLKSPCKSICKLDPRFDRCSGCGRAMSEIGGWMAMSEAQQARVIAELPRHLERMRAAEAAPAPSSSHFATWADFHRSRG